MVRALRAVLPSQAMSSDADQATLVAAVAAKDDEAAREQAAALGLPFEPLAEAPTDLAVWGDLPVDLMVRHA